MSGFEAKILRKNARIKRGFGIEIQFFNLFRDLKVDFKSFSVVAWIWDCFLWFWGFTGWEDMKLGDSRMLRYRIATTMVLRSGQRRVGWGGERNRGSTIFVVFWEIGEWWNSVWGEGNWHAWIDVWEWKKTVVTLKF